jgi:hypothetical protein
MKLTEEKLIELGFEKIKCHLGSDWIWFIKNFVTIRGVPLKNGNYIYAYYYDDSNNKFRRLKTIEELTILYEFLTETKL